MLDYLTVEDPQADSWDSFLKLFPEGNFEQSFEYGEIFKETYPRGKVVRLLVLQGEQPIGLVQGTYSSYLGFGMDLRVMRGPVTIVGDGKSSELAGKLLDALENYCRRSRIIHARIYVPGAWQANEAFEMRGYVVTERLNEFVVELGDSVDLLWQRIDGNKRRNIRKAVEAGVEVIDSRDREDLVAFYSLLKNAAGRHGFNVYPFSFYEAVWRAYGSEFSRVFLANWGGKGVSGVFVAVHGKTVFTFGAGSLREGFKVRPNDILHWTAMKWAIERGYSAYHMGMLSEPPPVEGSSSWGIWRWKREWKGALKRIQVFSKSYLSRYGLILRAKEVAERGYTYFRPLR